MIFLSYWFQATNILRENKIYMTFETKYICGGLFEMKTLFGLERLEYILSVFTNSGNFKALKA